MEQPQSIHRIYETNLWISSWAQEIAFFWGLDWCSLTMQNYAFLQEKKSKAEALESQVALCGQLKGMKKDNKLLSSSTQRKGELAHAEDTEQMTPPCC